MSFATPVLLAGLALVPLLLVLYVRAERRRGRTTAAFAAPQLMDAVAPRRPRWRRHVPIAILGLAVAGLIVALARPQVTVAVPVEQATVVIATDRSGSMLAKDVAPSRLVAARRAADTFLDAVPDDVRVGAVAFNHKPTVLQTPTRDHAAVREALASVQAAGSTATGDALAAALRTIEAVALAAGQEAAAGGDRPALRRQERPRPRRARGGRGGAQGEDPRLHRRARHRDRHDRVQARRRQHRQHPGAARPRDAASRSPSGRAARRSRSTTPRSSSRSTSGSARSSRPRSRRRR